MLVKILTTTIITTIITITATNITITTTSPSAPPSSPGHPHGRICPIFIHHDFSLVPGLSARESVPAPSRRQRFAAVHPGLASYAGSPPWDTPSSAIVDSRSLGSHGWCGLTRRCSGLATLAAELQIVRRGRGLLARMSGRRTEPPSADTPQ